MMWAAPILYIALTLQDANIKVDYTFGKEQKTIVLTGKQQKILKQFQSVYDIIENKDTRKSKQMQVTIEELSEVFLTPAADFFKQATHVNFSIDKAFARSPLDLLVYNQKPLFLTHAITFTAPRVRAKNPSVTIRKGYFLADPTTDPEDGLKTVSKSLKGSVWYATEDASLAKIAVMGDYDALVVSAHGSLDANNSGSMGINDEDFDSDLLERINIHLAYFDACQMGANWDFVEVFESEQTAGFMLAPITSNDAGDSSTLTVIWFFEFLRKNSDAAVALRQTRAKLYLHYEEQGLDIVTMLNKAFCFRLYEFSH